MIFKKSGKHIFGVNLNSDEQKALDEEINKQIGNYVDDVYRDIVVLVLYVLRTEYDFTEDELHKFYDNFGEGILSLINHYELDKSDDAWICKRKLKEDGIDVDKWEREQH